MERLSQQAAVVCLTQRRFGAFVVSFSVCCANPCPHTHNNNGRPSSELGWDRAERQLCSMSPHPSLQPTSTSNRVTSSKCQVRARRPQGLGGRELIAARMSTSTTARCGRAPTQLHRSRSKWHGAATILDIHPTWPSLRPSGRLPRGPRRMLRVVLNVPDDLTGEEKRASLGERSSYRRRGGAEAADSQPTRGPPPAL